MDPFTEEPTVDYFENFTDFETYNLTMDIGASQTTVYFSIFIVVSILGLVGNALAMFVVLRYRHMWTTINIYIFNLALGDLLYMLCLLLFAVETAYYSWPLGSEMCSIFWAVSTSVIFTSTFFLTIMSINDCVRVYFPIFSSNKLGPKTAVVLSVCTWFMCTLLGIPIFMYASLDELNFCKAWSAPGSFYSITITAYLFVLAFVVPLALVGVSLCLTAAWMRRHKKKADSLYGTVREGTILVFALSLVYVLIWLPMHVLEITSALGVVPILSETLYYFISIVPYLKCCIYPILYGFLSQSFKEAYKSVFCCVKGDRTLKNVAVTDEAMACVYEHVLVLSH